MQRVKTRAPEHNVIRYHYPLAQCAAGAGERTVIPVELKVTTMNTEIAAVLIDIEAQLRQLGLWDRVAPAAQALASTQPFCVDTLNFPQWLQFILLPTLYRMLEQGQPLPQRCGIAPMAQEYFRGTGLASGELVASLLRIDELLSAGAQPPG